MGDIIDSSRLTVLYSHGNAEDLGVCGSVLRRMAQSLGCNVVGYDYIGYGPCDDAQQGGVCSEENTFLSIETVFRWLVETKGIPASRIVLYGRSLGGGPTAHLAAKEPAVCGVVLQSTFLSAIRILTPMPLFGDIFLTYKRLPHILAPVFVIHGIHDEVISLSHGEVNNFLLFCYVVFFHFHFCGELN